MPIWLEAILGLLAITPCVAAWKTLPKFEAVDGEIELIEERK